MTTETKKALGVMGLLLLTIVVVSKTVVETPKWLRMR
jgi:hypothetical protein